MEDPDCVTITWSDGHQGTYGYPWLEERQFTEVGIQRRSLDFTRKPVLWNSELQGKVTRIDYTDVSILKI